MKITFFEYRKREKSYLSKKLSEHDLLFCKDKLTVENADKYSDTEAISVFINSSVSLAVISKLPKLKMIATRSTGFDHIDLNVCKKRGIKVFNVPSYGENTVAEHAMALLLALTRRLPESIERVRNGNFSPEGLTGVDLKGKVIGVIGTGHIGKNLINMANGFSLNILAYDLHPDEEFADKIGFEYVELDYLLSKSDIISLHVPYLKATHHIINRSSIAKMKKGVLIINTARGGLVETDALFDGIRSGQIGGAGLDVVEEESFLKEELELLYRDSHGKVDFKIALENHMMAYLPNVIITPHNAFNSKEAIMRILDTTIENITSYVNGNYRNVVTVN